MILYKSREITRLVSRGVTLLNGDEIMAGLMSQSVMEEERERETSFKERKNAE